MLKNWLTGTMYELDYRSVQRINDKRAYKKPIQSLGLNLPYFTKFILISVLKVKRKNTIVTKDRRHLIQMFISIYSPRFIKI